MADYSLPLLTSQYTDFLQFLKDRDTSQAKLFDGTGDTNLPTNAIRWNASNDRFEKWNGTSWVVLSATVANHIASTSNPHNVTAAQVGAPTQAAFDAHATNTSNPHGTTAAQVGAPTTAQLTAHTTNTSNPHSVTTTQISALNKNNNLSDVTNAATARSNIAAADSATANAHYANMSNPHGVTRAQISAAALGANGDITSMTACSTFTSSSLMRFRTTGSSFMYWGVGGIDRLEMDNSNNLYPSAAGGLNLGTSTNWFNGITANTLVGRSGNHLVIEQLGASEVRIKNNGTLWWTFGSGGILTPTTNGTQDFGLTTNHIATAYINTVLPFTGSHMFDDDEAIGDFVNGDAVCLTDDGMIVRSSSAYDARIIGIYVRKETRMKKVKQGKKETMVPDGAYHIVAALGDAQIDFDKKGKRAGLLGFNVCDQNGPIEVGTLLATSDVPGYLMAQGDDVIRSCTVGKSAMRAKFDDSGTMRGLRGFIYAG